MYLSSAWCLIVDLHFYVSDSYIHVCSVWSMYSLFDPCMLCSLHILLICTSVYQLNTSMYLSSDWCMCCWSALLCISLIHPCSYPLIDTCVFDLHLHVSASYIRVSVLWSIHMFLISTSMYPLHTAMYESSDWCMYCWSSLPCISSIQSCIYPLIDAYIVDLHFLVSALYIHVSYAWWMYCRSAFSCISSVQPCIYPVFDACVVYLHF